MAQLPDISEILLRGTTEPDPDKRREAEGQIHGMLESNFPLALCTLTNEISQESKDPNSRRVAGAVFKNALYSKNTQERNMKEAKWLEIDAGMRDQIKNQLINTLTSPVSYAANAAAVVISRIAQIELPRELWPDLIDKLGNMAAGQQGQATHTRAFAQKTLGFICEEIPPKALESKSNFILSAIIQGMRRSTENVEIIVSALEAFYNCLKFIEKNFEVDNEREEIMRTLLDTAEIPEVHIQTMSLMCLVEIASLYYCHLQPYMEKIFPLTMKAIREVERPGVACQAIEFWSTICDEEIEICDEEDIYLALIDRVLPYLLPPLLDSYQQRDYDDDDEDSLNIAIVASRCVANIALVVKDKVVDHVLPSVKVNIGQPEWQKRDSATMLFADILEGPSDEKMLPLIQEILPTLFAQLESESVHLKDTTVWTIARICKLYKEYIRQNVTHFLRALHPHFQSVPQIANHCCFAVHSIAEAFADDVDEDTSPMSQYFLFLIEELLNIAYRPDGHEIGLRAIAFESIAVVIQNGARDTNEDLLKTIPPFLEKLEETFKMQIVSIDDKERQTDLQGYLCTILTHITQKVGKKIQPHGFDRKMLELFHKLFESHAASGKASIHVDVLMVLGAVVNVIEGEFHHYLGVFMPFILQAMRSTQEPSVIRHCVGLITDLAGALKKDFFRFCNEIIDPLFLALKDDNLDRNVKPLIISCFGDIANAIGASFSTYLQSVCQVLVAAASTPREDPDDEPYQEFLCNLRVSIFDAYTGIIQGLRVDEKGDLFLPFGSYMMEFIDRLVEERNEFPDDEYHRRDAVLSVMVGAIGDFAELGGTDVAHMINRPSVRDALREATSHHSQVIQKLGEWASRVVSGLLHSQHQS